VGGTDPTTLRDAPSQGLILRQTGACLPFGGARARSRPACVIGGCGRRADRPSDAWRVARPLQPGGGRYDLTARRSRCPPSRRRTRRVSPDWRRAWALRAANPPRSACSSRRSRLPNGVPAARALHALQVGRPRQRGAETRQVRSTALQRSPMRRIKHKSGSPDLLAILHSRGPFYRKRAGESRKSMPNAQCSAWTR
jgi:hypothetical protein